MSEHSPCFEVLTRCFQRPLMLMKNQASLLQQSDEDWSQTLIFDEIGIGVPAANARLADIKVDGAYIWVLDDDDICINPKLFATLKAVIISMRTPPAALIVRMDHGPLGVLPPETSWGRLPQQGQIGSSAIFTRRDIWYEYRDHWRAGRYEADYDFIAAVLRHESHVVWLNLVAAAVQWISRGAKE
jgi:hypothetical protein